MWPKDTLIQVPSTANWFRDVSKTDPTDYRHAPGDWAHYKKFKITIQKIRKRSIGVPIVVDDEGDCFEKNTVLGIGMLDFLGLWRFLGLVQDRFQALIEPPTDSRIIGRWVVLEEPQ